MDDRPCLAPKNSRRFPRTTSREPRTANRGFVKSAKWFAASFALAALAAAVKRAEEGQLFSSEVAWKATLLFAVGALVQGVGAFVSAVRSRRRG